MVDGLRLDVDGVGRIVVPCCGPIHAAGASLLPSKESCAKDGSVDSPCLKICWQMISWKERLRAFLSLKNQQKAKVFSTGSSVSYLYPCVHPHPGMSPCSERQVCDDVWTMEDGRVTAERRSRAK